MRGNSTRYSSCSSQFHLSLSPHSLSSNVSSSSSSVLLLFLSTPHNRRKMVTVRTTEAPLPRGPKLESLTHIDISKLSQSELQALSLCSDAAFDLRRTDDVVTPQIDRSLFNESAGSRRQTYSRLRHSSTSAGHRSRLPGLLPNPSPLPARSPDDPERAENKSIVNFLKHLIAGGEIGNSPPLQPQTLVSGEARAVAQDMQMVLYSGEKKRKRERKQKPPMVPGNGNEIQLEIVNKNGVVVDLKALENGDEFYSAELRRRTVGLESEEGVLGFLRDLEGQWGSRRKRRRIVDAAEFGDALPIGWKLLLGLKRREGRVSVYCRRYVSPNGQQFASCKEASSYLQSYFGLKSLNDASQQLDQTGQQVYAVVSENVTEFSLMGIDNLPEVQVRDLFECYKCNMTFDEKDPYLKHLMSFHQRTTRRYRLGSSIGEGVIIKDGNYECQICHKVFQERRSYNGHVGVHVRNHVRNSEQLPGEATVPKSNESPYQDKLPPRISKMDALIEIAQSSILETSAEPNDKTNDGSSRTLEVATVLESRAANSDKELSLHSGPIELDLEDCTTKSILGQGSDKYDVQCVMTDKVEANSDYISHVEDSSTVVCTGTFGFPDRNEVEKHGNSDREIGLISQLTPSSDVVTWSSNQTVKENILQNGIADSSVTVVQSLHSFPSPTAISNKGESEFCTVDQKIDDMTGFDELRLEEMDPLQFSFMNGQESPSLPGVSLNVANDDGLEEVFNSAARFESEALMLNIDARRQFTTVCVWCRTEFNHEAFESETQSDSVGFMCPACKAKISGQLNVLDSGLSMNSRL